MNINNIKKLISTAVLLLFFMQNTLAQTTWTVAIPPSGLTAQMGSVGFANSYGKYVAAGDGLKYISSNDGVNWADEGTIDVAPGATVYDITWVFDRWVASTNVGLFMDAKIYTSASATSGTWTQSSTGLTNATALKFAYNFSNTVIATTGEGKLLKSTDGINWTIQDISSVWGGTSAINGIVYGGNQWVIVGSGGRIATSPNGNTWTLQSSPTGLSLQAIAYDFGRYVAVGPNNLAVWSTNGINWTAATIGVTSTFNDIAYGNSLFYAVGANGAIVSSPDGVTWTVNNSNAGTGTTFRGVCRGFTPLMAAVGGSTTATAIRSQIPPPDNDNCSGATALTPAVTCSPINGTALGATPDTGPGVCTDGTAADNAVWYKFTATAAAHTVTVDGGPEFDAVIGALTTCGGTTRPTGGDCTDIFPNGGIETMILTGLTIGSTYYIQVHDYEGNNSANATFSICISTPLVNDNCSGAIALTPAAACTPISGTTEGATADTGAGVCTNGSAADNAVWYKFTATAVAHTVTVDGDPNFDAVIGALTACGGTTRPTGGGCTDNTFNGGIETMILTGLTIGFTYYIQVHDFVGNNSANATFNICISTPPANDNCSGATALTPAAACTPVAGTTFAATADSGSGLCTGFGAVNAVWYKFIASSTAHTVAVDGDPDFDAVIGALNFCGGSTRPTGGNCTDVTGNGGIETMNLTGLAIGSTYYIQVHDFVGNNSANATFNICISTPPVNDNCSGATALTPAVTCNPISGTTAGATPDTGSGVCLDGVGPDNAVWFKFVATATSHIVTVDGDPNFDAVIGAVNVCGGIRPAGGNCTDATFGGGIETMTLTGLTGGATYYIQVHDYEGDNFANSTFTICVTLPQPPVNDNCSGATALTPAPTCNPISGTTENATPDSGPGICTVGTSENAVWYKFVATATTHTVTVDGDPAFNAVIGALTACGGTTRPIGGDCTDVTGNGGVETMTLTGLTIGTTYYIQVHDRFGGNNANSTFTICVTFPVPLAVNDECSGAINCTPTAGTWNNPVSIGHSSNAATQSLVPINCNGFTSNTAKDIWYSFQTDNNGGNITITYSGNEDIVLEAFSGSCGALSSIGCSDNVGLTESFNLTGLAGSTTYFLRAYIFDGGTSATSFSGTLTPTGTALPVELTAFSGKVDGPVNTLAWETAAEVNAQWHIIERSADSRKWTEIAKVPAKNAAAQYSAEDRQPLPQAYYRLRSVDFDGREQLSNSIVLTRTDKGFNIASVFPSPTQDEVTVQFNTTTSEERIRLRVTDIMGRLLLEQPIEAQKGLNTTTLSLANLPAGMYLIGLDNGTVLSTPVRVMKE
jgi:hypothetical protein